METTRTEGSLREAAGEVKESIGAMVGDARMEIEGKTNALYGNAQQLCADASDLARDTITSNPLGALAGAAAMGFVMGALWAWNRGDSA